MKVAYIDCFSGIAGDMFVGALLDAGASEEVLRNSIATLPISNYEIFTEKVMKQGIEATNFHVELTKTCHKHRNYNDIKKIIDESGLNDWVKEMATKAFEFLAKAEGKVHGKPFEEVHFHEVGAIDSIIDVVGAIICFDNLGVHNVYHRIVPLGQGTVETQHGTMAMPSPATLEILNGSNINTEFTDRDFELTTPTGIAILRAMADKNCGAKMPPMSIYSVGYGTGDHEYDNPPNLLRIALGEVNQECNLHDVMVLETTIDDCTPEVIGNLFDQLLETGAFDVFLTPIAMKKNRQGTMLTVLSSHAKHRELAEMIIKETTTFGVRIREEKRLCLDRKFVNVKTPYGEISVKCGFFNDEMITFSPEFEDCKKASKEHKVSLDEVYFAAKTAARENLKDLEK